VIEEAEALVVEALLEGDIVGALEDGEQVEEE
jgi:hypothetical protein